MHPLILFWSHNPDLYLLFSHILAADGFKSALVNDAELEEQAARAAVLAVLIDAEDNIERALLLCNQIRSNRATAHIPLLALLPGGNDQHYLDLLRAGVTEGFVRPISPARIVTYLQSLASGSPGGFAVMRASGDLFNVWELTLEISRRLVRHGAEELHLGPIEFKLLCRLLEAPGRVFSRSELIEAAWPPNYYVQPRTVDVHVGRLRRSLAQMTGRNLIRTIRSTGYAVEFG
jgi:two-component system phosphate regulon response regulator PhoB